MSAVYDHLAPECREEANLPTLERIRRIQAERWIGYPRTELVLNRLNELLHYPQRDRMPCLLLYAATGMGKTKIPVSSARAEALTPGWHKPLPVLVRINDKSQVPWRINLMPAGNGEFYLYLHESVRKASGTSVGDRVSVELLFDANYRSGPQHRMPQWFKQGLDANPQALKNWAALIPSRKKEILRYFSQLKSLDARTRNLSKALRVSVGRGRAIHGARLEKRIIASFHNCNQKCASRKRSISEEKPVRLDRSLPLFPSGRRTRTWPFVGGQA